MPANILIAGMARSYNKLKTKAAGISCGFCISATIAALIA
jgi:hypothetical protein